jgi:hypothetical protein
MNRVINGEAKYAVLSRHPKLRATFMLEGVVLIRLTHDWPIHFKPNEEEKESNNWETTDELSKCG